MLALLLLAVLPQPRTVDELKSAVQAVLARERVPGAGIVIVAPDRLLWAGGIGKADLASGREVTPDTVFRAGSISKSFVALALVKLQEQGRIDLNAPLKEIAPELEVPNRWEATRPVRAVHVLEHTAGFDDSRPTDLPAYLPLRELLARMPGPQRVRWPPGTRFAYSNAGYCVAGYLVEKASGRPFEEYIQDEILKPLGMERSSFRLAERNRALLAQGYNLDGVRSVTYQPTPLRPAGGLTTSPADLARFVQMWLNRGRLGGGQLLRPESVARIEQPRTSLAARAGLQVGYGLGSFSSNDFPVLRHGHGGAIDGFMAAFAYMPDQARGYVVMLNRWAAFRALREIERIVFNYATAGMPTSEPPSVSLAPEQLRRFAGFYEPADFRTQLSGFAEVLSETRHVYVSGPELHQSVFLSAGRQKLVPTSAATFRKEWESLPSLVFTAAEDGTPVMTGLQGYYRRVPSWKPYARISGLTAGFLLMLSALVYALVWVPARLRGRPMKHVAVRAVPLAAVLSFALALTLVLTIFYSPELTTFNFKTAAYCALTWVFPVLSLWALFLARHSFTYELRPAVRIHALLVSLACCGFAVWFAAWGLLGLRLWTY